ncbi:MAG TPA: basic amino acid ABC transporter substrate-binding protein [Actinomycetota bacterium]
MMYRRFGWPIALGLVLALVAAGCGKKSTPGGTPTETAQKLSTKKPGFLTVGSCLNYKPFEFYEGNTLKGFDVEVMQEIAKRLNLKVEWVKADFDTIFTALAAGQFDAVAAASTIKPERQQVVDFSDPYYNARQSLTVNTSKTPDITSTDQLTSGQVVGVQKGTTGKDWAEANLGTKGIKVKTFTEITDAFTDLEAGQIVGIINDEPSSQSEVESRPGLKVVQPIDTGEFYGIAVGKDHKDILDAINKSLKAMIDDGTYKTIFAKYFPGVPVPPQFGG